MNYEVRTISKPCELRALSTRATFLTRGSFCDLESREEVAEISSHGFLGSFSDFIVHADFIAHKDFMFARTSQFIGASAFSACRFFTFFSLCAK
jgi:hypothetical protein